MFDTSAEAQQKLSGCVALFNSQPTMIHEASGSGSTVTLLHRLLGSSDILKTNIWDKGWDFKSVGTRLGYSNIDMSGYKEALYLTRMHIRKSHSTQGVSKSNIRIPSLRGSERLGTPKTNIQWETLTSSKSFLDTLEQKYPTVKEAVERFKDTNLVSIAFQQKLAIRKPHVGPYYLEYRGKDIGYTDDLYKWKVANDFRYLNETLEHYNLRIA